MARKGLADKRPPSADAVMYLDWAEVARRTSLSRSTIFRLTRQGRFPPSVKLSPGRVAWSERAVNAWLDERQQNTGAYVG